MISHNVTDLRSGGPATRHIVSYLSNLSVDCLQLLRVTKPEEILAQTQAALQAVKERKKFLTGQGSTSRVTCTNDSAKLSSYRCLQCGSRDSVVCSANLCNEGAYRDR